MIAQVEPTPLAAATVSGELTDPQSSDPEQANAAPSADPWGDLEKGFRAAEKQWEREQQEQRERKEAEEERRKKEKERAASEPTARDKREALLYQLAEVGDVDALMPLLDPDPILCLHEALAYRPVMFFIRKALDALARDDPKKLVEFLGAKALAFQGEILLRAQLSALRKIARHDKEVGESGADIPDEVAEVWLPRIAAIQSSIEQTGASLSRTAHTLELAGRVRSKQKKQPAEKDDDDGTKRKTRRSTATQKESASPAA